jgi:uncharacterized protein (TIGR01244 family)
LTVCVGVPVLIQAGDADTVELANVTIDNFGRVNPHYYRGAEPAQDDYADLAALGIRTLIDLRSDDTNPLEKDLAEQAGMTYVTIPMTTRTAPSADQIDVFLRTVNDPERQPVYVHCVGGRHRTGVMTAIYRMTQDNWTPNQAFKEMKTYKFGADFLHPEFKRFVLAFKPHPVVRASAAEAVLPIVHP